MGCLLMKGGVTQSLYNKKVGRHKSWGKKCPPFRHWPSKITIFSSIKAGYNYVRSALLDLSKTHFLYFRMLPLGVRVW